MFSSISKRLQSIGLDNFILALFCVVILAYIYPQGGLETSPIPLKKISNWGVSIIFFFYGLKLSPEKLKAGLKNIPLHFLIQSATFLLFPVIVWIAQCIFQPQANDQIWIGIFFIAALPSTVSSSVVMVSMAKGNIPAAIFNASISSLIGVFMTPIIMGIFMTTSGEGMDLYNVIIDLILQVIVPVTAGILLYPYFGKKFAKYAAQLKYFDQAVILMIVYQSFCTAFFEGLYQKMSAVQIVSIFVSMFLLFVGVYFLTTKISRLLKFNTEDTITAAFCGSKKSLVHGTVMSSVIFKGNPNVGVILLPLMVYHTIQLIASSIIAQRLGKRSIDN